MAKGLRIKFRIGKTFGEEVVIAPSSATTKGQLEAHVRTFKILDKITDAIAAEAIGITSKDFKVRLGRLTTRLEAAIASEYANGVRFAARNLIGLKSRGVDPIQIFMAGEAGGGGFGVKAGSLKVPKGNSGVINWAPLSKRTFYDKKKQAPPRFFIRSGALQKSLLTSARKIVDRTGIVQVTFHDENTKLREGGRFASWRKSKQVVKIGDLRIRLMPKVPRGALPGLVTGEIAQTDHEQHFEKMLGLGASNTRKLYGPLYPAGNNKQRPLLQPVFTYWTLFKIPQAIAGAINSSVHTATAKGVEDFGSSSGGSFHAGAE